MSLNQKVRSSEAFLRLHKHIQEHGYGARVARVRTQGGQMLNVYPNQELVALYVKTAMEEAYKAGHSSSIVVLAHPQSGKTTCETRSIEMIDELVKADVFKNDVGRYHHAGKPLRTLIQQTIARLPAGVRIVTAQDITWKQDAQTRRGKEMLDNLKSNLRAGCEIALHDDEVHLNRKTKGSLNTFLHQKLGIPSYAKPPTSWDQRHVHVVGYSASPFGHLMHVGNKPGVFTVIYMRPGNGYQSLKDIYNSGRIEHVDERIVVKHGGTFHLSADFITACKAFMMSPDPGYFFVRSRNDHKHAAPLIKDFFKKLGVSVQEAICKNKGSIEAFKKQLDVRPAKKEVWLIQKAFGAGDTLCQDNIIAVWEGTAPIKSSMDSRLQEICRWCGYSVNPKMKIYASHAIIKEIINFWDAIESRLQFHDGAEELEQTVLSNIIEMLPSGTANESGKSPKTPKLKIGTVFSEANIERVA